MKIKYLLPVIFFISSLAFFNSLSFAQDGAEVSWKRVNVRSGPGTNYARIGGVYRGERYPVIGGAGNWINIQLKDGREGWVRSDTVKLIEVVEAIEDEETSMKRKARNLYRVGLVQLEVGDYGKALEMLVRARELNPDMDEVLLPLGRSYLETKEYPSALETFEVAMNVMPDSPNPPFFLGLTSYRMKRYPEAVEYLEQAEGVGVDLEQARGYYIGLSHYRKGDYPPSKGFFIDSYQLDPNSPIGISSKKYLDKIHALEGKQRWSLGYKLGMQYDDNIKLANKDVAEEVGGLRSILFFGGEFLPVIRPGWSCSLGLDLYQNLHLTNRSEDVGDFDLTSIKGSSSFALDSRLKEIPYNFLLTYYYNYILLKGDSYSNSHNIMPTLIIPMSKRLMTMLYYRYQLEKFPDQGERDGSNNMIGGSQSIYLAKNKYRLNIGLSFDNETCDKDSYNYRGYRISAGFHAPIIWKITGDTNIGYYIQDYHKRDDGRSDKIQTYSFKLVSGIFNLGEASLGYTFATNNSLDLYKYKRNLMSVFFSGSF